jgi:hypothetical protein
MKQKMTHILIICLTCISLVACQATPEKTAVVYGGGLEESIKSSPAPFVTYDVPLSWQETLDMKGSDTSVEINAQISVPDVTAFPVYKIKPTTFDVTRIESLVDYFTKGRDVIKDKEPTKAELEQQLLLAKKANDEVMTAELEKMIAVAPETVEDEVITDWSPDKSPGGSFLAEDGEYARIDVSPDRFGYTNNGFILSERWLSSSDIDKIADIAISEEDAIAAAQDMLHELGLGYMTAAGLEKAQRYASHEDAYAQPVEEPLSKGYMVKFARDIDGIAGIMNDYGVMFGVTDDFAYRAPLYPEDIQVYVDEEGKALSFEWAHPLETEKKLTENAALLPFEDVKQRIRDLLIYIDFNDDIPVQVTNIDMNMAIVGVKDHPDEAMYVPAWFVYYTETFYDRETGGNAQQKLRLALNAIDGGRVLECPVEIASEIQQMIDEDLQGR